MYLIREVFKTKPGKAKDLVATFKKAAPYMEKDGYQNLKIMTDFVADYWTVVVQLEIDNFDIFVSEARSDSAGDEVRDIMKGYMDLVQEGHREIYKLE
jgi:hypothetical protein